MMHKMSENQKVTFGEITSALGGESSDVITSKTFVDMALYDIVEAIGIASELASGSTITLKMYEATAANGGGSATISGASDTFLSTNVTDVDVLRAQVRAADLSAGYQYVGAKISTDDASGTEEAALILIQSKPRYGQATLS